jgi:DNA-binding transcriptional LysR family regulator
VHAGSLDAGFIHLPRASLTGLCVLELDDEHKVVALPAQHPLARHRQIHLGQLAREPFILFDRALEPDTYDRLHEACRRHGFQPDVVQMTTNLQSTIGLVAAGLGVALIMESVAAGMQRSGVVFRALKPPEISITNGVVWRTQNANPALAVLEKALRRHQAGPASLASRSLAGS